MAHITLSIPDAIFREMKRHPEIKWSEVARRNIIEKVDLFRNVTPARDLWKLLPEETRESIEKTDEKAYAEFFSKMKKRTWERTNSLTQA